MTRDDELLDVLAASLGSPPDAEPAWAEISQLHRVIDSSRSGRVRSRVPMWRIRRPLTAAMAGVLVLGGASAAAAASGAVMPQPVRVAARAVGLPVDSPDLADARAALARLRDALGAKPRDLVAVRARAQELRDRLGRLSADDRSHIEDETQFLLAEADGALAQPPVTIGSPLPAPSAPSNATPTAPSAPTAVPSADDHGGRSGPSAEPEHSSGSDNHSSADDHSGSSNPESGSGSSGPGPSGPSGGGGGDDHTATTSIQTDNSGHGGSDDGGSSHDGGDSSDGGGHSGPG